MKEKKTVIITGANSGLGYACTELIAAKREEYRVIMGCRDEQRAQKAKEELVGKTGNEDIVTFPLNLASLSSVRHFVDLYKESMFDPVYGLICNAGISGIHTGRTEDDIDCIFESNHLGHFLLTTSMMPVMREDGRILIVSSDMHCPPSGELVWLGTEAIAHPDQEMEQNRNRYSYSKLCNLYFTYELSRRLQESGSKVTVNAFNPGLMTDTNFAPDKSRFTKEMLAAVSNRIGSLENSSKALAALMTEAEYKNATGQYFDRSTEAASSSPLSYNKENAAELWEKSICLVKNNHNKDGD